VLSRQFQQSPFSQTTTDRKPITLDVFDFDSTLFLSPLLSSNLWHSSFINSITTENLVGPGWWRDIRSLEVDGPWDEYWNEDVLQEVRKSCADPTHLTVLLTGRRYHPFHTLIEAILASKGLIFDVIGLRPDPETDEPDHPTGLRFNFEPNVFATTMEFKASFIVNILSSVPSLQQVMMWDDRPSHICVFETYLADMVKLGIIKKGHIFCIKPAKPKYNPEWEYKVVNDMLRTHNDAVMDLVQQSKLYEVPRVITENNGQIIHSTHLFELEKVNWLTVLHLSPETTNNLQKVFEPSYRLDLSTEARIKPLSDWEHRNAERSMYFGHEVFLAINEERNNQALYQKYKIKQGKQFHFNILARSVGSQEFGMALQVEIDAPSMTGNLRFILPLWYKPSHFKHLMVKRYQWLPLTHLETIDSSILKGNVDYHHLLTIKGSDPEGFTSRDVACES
jgi:hypothetical protein